MTAAGVGDVAARALELLTGGAVRVVGVWPRAADAVVFDGGQRWRCRCRGSAWSCSCGAEGCAHVAAVRLVARPVQEPVDEPVEGTAPARARVSLRDLASFRDSWVWAIRAFRAVAAAPTIDDEWIDAGRVLEQLEPAALLDVAITMAKMPANLRGRAVTEANLDRLTVWMTLSEIEAPR